MHLITSLLASGSDPPDRRFAVNQILKLRGYSEYADTSVRPRVTPKLNLSATSLTKLITWKAGKVDEHVLTCSMTRAVIKAHLYHKEAHHCYFLVIIISSTSGNKYVSWRSYLWYIFVLFHMALFLY
jgi:hypothetical protein